MKKKRSAGISVSKAERLSSYSFFRSMEVHKSQSVLPIRLAGGLGNQLFIFSTGMIRAHEEGADALLDLSWFRGRQRQELWWRHRRTFLLNRVSPEIQKLQRVYDARVGPWRVSRVPKGCETLAPITDWPRSFEFFEKKRDLISSFVEPKSRHLMKVEGGLTRLVKPGTEPLAIHVRLGDHLHSRTRNPVLREEYYLQALEKYNLDEYTLLVFSDSPAICRRWSVFKNAKIVQQNSPVMALRLMSMSKGFIGSLSTLSWWVAWMMSGTKPHKVTMPSTDLADEFSSWRDLYNPHWSTIGPGANLVTKPDA